MELKNNTVLITGGTSGLGLEFAKRLIDLENTVIITGRNPEKLEEVRRKVPDAHMFQSDVSRPEAIRELYRKIVDKFPKLNILINNAGEMRKISLHDTSIGLEDITREIDINLSGPIRMVQQFLPQLKKQKKAAIVNVTSGIALMPFPVSPIYGATKSGLRSYSKSLRVQLKNSPVAVFELIAPGARTPLNDKFLNMDGFNPKMLMAPEKIVAEAMKGMKNDTYEIYPGLAKMIRILSRVAPGLAFRQASKMGQDYFLHAESNLL